MRHVDTAKLEQPVTIEAEERDAISRLHAALAGRGRETAHSFRKLRVSERLVVFDDSYGATKADFATSTIAGTTSNKSPTIP